MLGPLALKDMRCRDDFEQSQAQLEVSLLEKLHARKIWRRSRAADPIPPREQPRRKQGEGSLPYGDDAPPWLLVGELDGQGVSAARQRGEGRAALLRPRHAADHSDRAHARASRAARVPPRREPSEHPHFRQWYQR